MLCSICNLPLHASLEVVREGERQTEYWRTPLEFSLWPEDEPVKIVEIHGVLVCPQGHTQTARVTWTGWLLTITSEA